MPKTPEEIRAYQKQWREANKEALRLKKKAYNDAHKEELKAYFAARHKEKREEIAAKAKARRDANPEINKERCREYYASHKEEARAYRQAHLPEQRVKDRIRYPEIRARKLAACRRYYAGHKQVHAAYAKAYHLAHRQEILLQHHEYYIARREEFAVRSKMYRANHMEEERQRRRKYRHERHHVLRALNMRREARKRNLPHTWTPTQRAFMLDYWHNACAICGNQRGFFWTLADDHWVPLVSPDCPGTVAENMIPLCHGAGGCNNKKKDHDPHRWLVETFGGQKAKKIEQAITHYFSLARTKD